MPFLASLLLASAVGLLVAWGAASLLLEAAAWRAERLGRRRAPDAFRTPPRRGPEVRTASLAFVGDMQRGVADVVRPLAAELARRPADLLVSCGDFAAHGEAPYYGVLFDAFDAAAVTTPLRAVPGNHDLFPRRVRDAALGGALFDRHFGARRFAERVGPLLVVGLDDATQGVVGEQREWLLKTLAEHAGVPWVCVCHRPPRNLEEPDARVERDLADFVALLEKAKPALVISGHKHHSDERVVNGVTYVVNTQGGDVSGLALKRGPFDLLRIDVDEKGVLRREYTRHPRRRWLRVYLNQLCVRLWCERRKPLGRVVAAPVGLLLAALRLRAPLRRATDPWPPAP